MTTPRSPRPWDALVVGGGFAGLAAAEAAARAGLRTLVVERKRAPGRPVHTTGLLCPDGVDLLRPPAALLGQRLDALRLHAPSGGSTRLERSGAGFTSTDTAALLSWMRDRAVAAGAVVRLGVAVRSVEEHDASVAVATTDGLLRARWLIGADGASSAVARAAGLRRPARLLVGVERHVEVADAGDLEADAAHLIVSGRWAPGYVAWAFRGISGIWQVGTLGPAGGARRGGFDPAASLGGVLAWLERRRGLVMRRGTDVRAGHVPVGGALRRPRTRRVVLVGDAAGHVSALTAGGIARAVAAGQAIGGVLADGPAAWDPVLQRMARRCGGTRRVLRLAWEACGRLGLERAGVAAAGHAWLRPLATELAFRRHPLAAFARDARVGGT